MSYLAGEREGDVMPIVRRNKNGDVIETFFDGDPRYTDWRRMEIERWRRDALKHGRFKEGEEPR